MSWSKLFNNFEWQNKPSTATPLGKINLQKLNDAIDEIDDRLITNEVEISDTLENGNVIANLRVGSVTTPIKAQQITVDNQLSTESENPVQNKVIYEALQNILPEETAEGNPISITDASGLNAKSCEVTFSPIQSGSGEPSPENVRPISGRDSVDLTRTGKNLWNKDRADAKRGYYNLDGTFASSSAYRCLSFPCSQGDKFIKSGTGWGGIATFWNGNNFVSGINAVSVTIPSGVNIVKFACTYASTDAQLELGSTATEYEPYQGQTHTATFPSTIYGGSHEFVSGKAKSEWGYIASYNGETITEPWISDRDVYVAGTTPSTGAEVCYKLATPQEITLTPETIALLKGNNVLWTDGDSVKLVYSADIKSYIAEQLSSLS